MGGDNKGITLNRLVDIMYIIGSKCWGLGRGNNRLSKYQYPDTDYLLQEPEGLILILPATNACSCRIYPSAGDTHIHQRYSCRKWSPESALALM